MVSVVIGRCDIHLNQFAAGFVQLVSNQLALSSQQRTEISSYASIDWTGVHFGRASEAVTVNYSSQEITEKIRLIRMNNLEASTEVVNNQPTIRFRMKLISTFNIWLAGPQRPNRIEHDSDTTHRRFE